MGGALLLLAAAFSAPFSQAQTLGAFEVRELETSPTYVVTDPDEAVLIVQSELTHLQFQSNQVLYDVEGVGRGVYQVRLAPGTHLITISAEGYKDVTHRVYLPPKDAVTIEVVEVDAPLGGRGVIEVATDPPGAEIILNDLRIAAETPMVLPNQPVGTHPLRIERPGYRPLDTLVTVVKDRTTEFTAVLRPWRAALRVESEPDDAVARLNGRTLGITPLVADSLEPGSDTLLVEKAGFRPARLAVELVDGDTVYAHAVLERLFGGLLVSSIRGAVIRVEGDSVGVFRDSAVAVTKVPAGSRRVSATLPGYREAATTVEVEPGRIASVRLNPTREPGAVRATSRPEGARVLVDGVPTDSSTPTVIGGLAPGEHRLRMELENYEEAQTRLTVLSGDTVRWNVRLAPQRGPTTTPPPRQEREASPRAHGWWKSAVQPGLTLGFGLRQPTLFFELDQEGFEAYEAFALPGYGVGGRLDLRLGRGLVLTGAIRLARLPSGRVRGEVLYPPDGQVRVREGAQLEMGVDRWISYGGGFNLYPLPNSFRFLYGIIGYRHSRFEGALVGADPNDVSLPDVEVEWVRKEAEWLDVGAGLWLGRHLRVEARLQLGLDADASSLQGSLDYLL